IFLPIAGRPRRIGREVETYVTCDPDRQRPVCVRPPSARAVRHTLSGTRSLNARHAWRPPGLWSLILEVWVVRGVDKAAGDVGEVEGREAAWKCDGASGTQSRLRSCEGLGAFSWGGLHGNSW